MSKAKKRREELEVVPSRADVGRSDFSRTDFLRLFGGAGVGVALSGAFAGFGAGEARAKGILGNGRFPVGLWWPPPPAETTVERYREISDAGFNFVIGGNGVGSDAANPQALEAAAANDLRFLLTDYSLHHYIAAARSSAARSEQGVSGSASQSPMRSLLEYDSRNLKGPDDDREGRGFRSSSSADSREEIRQRVLRLLELYGESTALAGLNLFDEPGLSLFDSVAHARSVLQANAGELLSYVNAWPSYAHPSALGTRSYPAYLQQYTSAIKAPMLSFDHYPLLGGRGITRDYFYNWAAVRRYSLWAGVPSWVFIQSVDFNGAAVGLSPRRRPSRADLLWQVNVSLAYGAKGIQYFTYWTPDQPGSRVPYGQALISKSGARTPLYAYARSVNAYLRSIGRVLLPMRSESVVHAGEGRYLPYGASPFRPDAFVRAVGGSPVILGWFRKPGLSPKFRYLLVVNRHSFKAATSTLTMTAPVASILIYSPVAGRFVNVPRPRGQNPRRLRVRLAPGAAWLCLLRRR